MRAKRKAVLLLAHGSPEDIADVPEFLRRVTGGRRVPEAVIGEIKHRYAGIGRSPLLEITQRQAELLQRELSLPVYVGMRNWKPFIAEAVGRMAAEGVESVVAICLAPQNSRTSVGLYGQALLSAMQETQMECRFVESWHDHPELIGAFAEKLKDGWTVACEQLGANAPVIFTAHSVPARTIHDGDPYEAQARATAQLVRQRLPELAAADVKFAFQSQGMSGEPWIEPTVEETILELKNAGHRGVVIQPIGFLCDHVEILYDIDIAFKKFAQQQGMRLWRTQSLNDSPHLIRALADLAQESQHAKASATRPLRS